MPLPPIIHEDAEVLAFDKPSGLLVAPDRWDKTRVNLMGLVHADPRLGRGVANVHRLDADTSGLLLWTTDGQVLQRLTHPKRKVPRTYQAALTQPFVPPPADFTLDDGHQPHITELREFDGSTAHPSLARPTDAALYASITITGGAYHEVRRIFAALGSHVTALCRVSFGPLVLPDDLPLGEYRPLRLEDVLGD